MDQVDTENVVAYKAHLSQWENFQFVWLPYSVLVKKPKLCVPWWLENRGVGICLFRDPYRGPPTFVAAHEAIGIGALEVVDPSANVLRTQVLKFRDILQNGSAIFPGWWNQNIKKFVTFVAK